MLAGGERNAGNRPGLFGWGRNVRYSLRCELLNICFIPWNSPYTHGALTGTAKKKESFLERGVGGYKEALKEEQNSEVTSQWEGLMPSPPGSKDYGPFKDETKWGEAGAEKGSKNLAGGGARGMDRDRYSVFPIYGISHISKFIQEQ